MYINYSTDRGPTFRLYSKKEDVTDNRWENVIGIAMYDGFGDSYFTTEKVVEIINTLIK